MMRNRIVKRITACLLVGLAALLSAACGKDNGNSGKDALGTGGAQNAGGEADDGYVYVPKFYDLPTDTEANFVSYTDMVFVGDGLYYTYSVDADESRSSEWCYIDAASPEAGPVVLANLGEYEVWDEETIASVICAAPCGEGGAVLLIENVPFAAEEQECYSIKQLARDGSEVFDKDITEYLRTGGDSSRYQMQMFTDEEGDIYISNDRDCVWVFDKEGNHTADIDLSNIQGYIAAVNILPDGRLGVVHQGNDGRTLMEVCRAEQREFSETYDNLPANCYNCNLEEGPNGGLLLNGNGGLCEYSMEEKEYRELFKWAECDIVESSVRQVKMLADGRIAVFCFDWTMKAGSLIVLDKVPASEVEETKTLILGCILSGSMLQEAVVEFNKTNSEYRIEIRNYGESYEDAKALMYNEIMAGNIPDMFLAEGIDVEMFAEKGLIEDLSPYLKASEEVRREDLFETVLNVYTVDDTLCAIPVTFCIQTLVGRTSEVGTEPGWTLEEMIAFAEAHPDTPILPDATKKSILNACMLFDMDSWVNYETGECFFDTPEFKKLMEFVNRYPAQRDASLPQAKVQIMEHMALLHPFILSEFEEWQVETAVFQEPITAIGYPSGNANGINAFGYDAVCVSSTSPYKDAAWSFIESLLAEKVQESEKTWGFPIRISSFEKKLAEAMEPNYMYDENGEIVLDENGNPKEYSNYTYGYSDGFEVKIYAMTQEEADGIRYLIEHVGIIEYDGNIGLIIVEEMEPYFAGQKSVDEAAAIIQRRVQLYLEEKR